MLLPRIPLFRDASLRAWLTASVTGAMLLAVVACVLLTGRFAQAHAERRALDALDQMAAELRDNLDQGMAQHLEELRVLSRLDQVRRTDDPAAVRAVLDQVRDSYPQFAWIGVADTSGRVLASAGGLLEGASVSQRPWFQAARQAGVYVGDVHAAVLLEKLLPQQDEPWRFVDFALPLQDDTGRTYAVLGAHLSWQWARQLQQDLTRPAMQARGVQAYVIGRDGSVILGSRGWSSREAVPAVVPSAGSVGSRQFAADTEDHVAVALPTRGRGRYAGLGWTVLVRQPVDTALADYFHLRRQIMLGAAVLLLLSAPVAWWLSRRLAAPLQTLTRAIARQQHLSDASMPRVADYREARLLSEALDSLSTRQAEQDRRLHELNASLEQRVQERTEELVRLNAGLQEAQRLSAASAHRLKTITDNLPVLISYIDKDLRLQFSNATFKQWMGLDPDAMLGVPLPAVIGEALYRPREPYLRRALAGERVEFEIESEARGVRRDLQNTYVPDVQPDGSVAGLFALSSDVTAMKLVERHLEQLTRVDVLTGLPNRRQLEERLQEALARSRRTGRPMALMFLDIDRFKHINDTFGHAAGDEVIKIFGHRLAASVRVTDTVARLAGDEFVVLLEGLNSSEEPQFVARKILAAVSAPTEVNGLALQLSTSIGIALCEAGGATAQHLLGEADEALYKAKAAGRNTYRLAPRAVPA